MHRAQEQENKSSVAIVRHAREQAVGLTKDFCVTVSNMGTLFRGIMSC